MTGPHPANFGSFPRLSDRLDATLGDETTMLAGEVVCPDKPGRARFNALLCRRQEPPTSCGRLE